MQDVALPDRPHETVVVRRQGEVPLVRHERHSNGKHKAIPDNKAELSDTSAVDTALRAVHEAIGVPAAPCV